LIFALGSVKVPVFGAERFKAIGIHQLWKRFNQPVTAEQAAAIRVTLLKVHPM
jgi:hypothetical protein